MYDRGTASSCPLLTLPSSETLPNRQLYMAMARAMWLWFLFRSSVPGKPQKTTCCFFDSCIFSFHIHILKNIILPKIKWCFRRAWRAVAVVWHRLLPAWVLRNLLPSASPHFTLLFCGNGGAALPFPFKGFSPFSSYFTVWYLSE